MPVCQFQHQRKSRAYYNLVQVIVKQASFTNPIELDMKTLGKIQGKSHGRKN